MLSNINPQSVPSREVPSIPPPAPPAPKIAPASKVINEMDLALSNDYKSLKSLEQMIKTNPENVIPPGDAPRLLHEVAARIREMRGKSPEKLVNTDQLHKRVLFLMEENTLDNTLEELAS